MERMNRLPAHELNAAVAELLASQDQAAYERLGHSSRNAAADEANSQLRAMCAKSAVFAWDPRGFGSGVAGPGFPCEVVATAVREVPGGGRWLPELCLAAGPGHELSYRRVQWNTQDQGQRCLAAGSVTTADLEDVAAALYMTSTGAAFGRRGMGSPQQTVASRRDAEQAAHWVISQASGLAAANAHAVEGAVREALRNTADWAGDGTVTVNCADGVCRVEVSDSGPGIRNRTGEPLYRMEALLQAVYPGASSSGDPFRGYGLWAAANASCYGAAVVVESDGVGVVFCAGKSWAYSAPVDEPMGVSVRLGWSV